MEQQRLEQINTRLFALEGRMNTFERVSQIEMTAQAERTDKILENQEKMERRTQRLELRLAAYAGAGVVLGTVINLVISAAIKTYIK